jgi:hypothetical protein
MRIGGQAKEIKMRINEMNITELTDLIAAASAQIEILRNTNSLVHISWQGRSDDLRKGKPYFAILTRGVVFEFVYNFVSDTSYDSRKANSGVDAVYEGDLPAGTVVRYRAGASWKNDYSFYAVVDASAENNLREISELEAKKIVGLGAHQPAPIPQASAPIPQKDADDYDGFDAAEAAGHYDSPAEKRRQRQFGEQ